MRFLSCFFALGTFVLLRMASGAAADPAAEPLKISAGEVLKYLDAHAWKWNYRAPAPYDKITLRFVHFIRLPSGEFQRQDLGSISSGLGGTRDTDEILIIGSEKEGGTQFAVTLGGVGVRKQTDIPFSSYARMGPGDGGAPQTIWSSSVLMTRYKNPSVLTGNKEDLEGYLAVEVESQ